MDLTDEFSKTRSDAWGEDLADDVRWQIYESCRGLPWHEVGAHLPDGACTPSRAAWYRFLARMRKADAARRIEKVAQSVAEAQDLADRHNIKAAVFVETLKSLAIDRAMTGNDKAATSLAAAAATIWSNAQRDAELSLKLRAQETRDAQLALAREKFEAAEKRLAAASATVADPSLTAEEKLKELDRLFGR